MNLTQLGNVIWTPIFLLAVIVDVFEPFNLNSIHV